MDRAIKVSLLNRDSTTKEMRKIYLGRKMNFDALHSKICQMFPEIREESFTISWMDSNDDTITITNDEELGIAWMENAVQFCVNIISKNKGNQVFEKSKVQHSAVCDGCGVHITGFRYKCIQCDNFDICEQCECARLHPDHFMIRMPQQLEYVHMNSILHHMRNLIKKNMARSAKRQASDKRASNSSCSIPIRLEDFADLTNLNDVILEIIVPDQEPSKGEEARENEECTGNAHVDKSTTKNLSGEGKELVDDAKDDNGAASDTSVASQDHPGSKIASDEWTILDKDETTEANPAPSALCNSMETNVPPSPPTAPTLSNDESMNQPIYPSLPSMTNATHHPDPVINKAVDTLIDMGFSNQNNLLTYLLISKNGDINKVIELLLLR